MNRVKVPTTQWTSCLAQALWRLRFEAPVGCCPLLKLSKAVASDLIFGEVPVLVFLGALEHKHL